MKYLKIMEENKNFDYDAAVKRVEEIISMLESPELKVSSAAPLLKEGMRLVDECRAYLRGVQASCGNRQE